VIELDEDVDPVAFDLDGLAAHCRANLARYKVPERFFIAPLARNAMGKVVAAEVRRRLGAVDLDAATT
jgi:acyl-CoA synthetase (AMP-forming)/AMP-acid ligase II